MSPACQMISQRFDKFHLVLTGRASTLPQSRDMVAALKPILERNHSKGKYIYLQNL